VGGPLLASVMRGVPDRVCVALGQLLVLTIKTGLFVTSVAHRAEARDEMWVAAVIQVRLGLG